MFLVGGGGAGGGLRRGGGAGGYVNTFLNIFLINSDYNVFVGSGGIGGATSGTSGTYSQFINENYRADGGSGASSHNGANGGSGGGAVASDGGSNGSNGESDSVYTGGIGQGTTTREWGLTTGKLYAGGGGGGYWSNRGRAGLGGAGGGGDGKRTENGQAGTNGLGGGGGSTEDGYIGGDGGSGIVLVRYQIPYENYSLEDIDNCDFNLSNLSSGSHNITLSVTDDVNTETADVNIIIEESPYPQEYLDYLSLVQSDGGEIINQEETLSMFNFLIDNDLYSNLVLGLSSSTGVKTRTSGSDLFVEKAYDFSGNNNHALQTTNENQPLLKDVGMEFDGNDDFLTILNSSSNSNFNNISICGYSKFLSNFSTEKPIIRKNNVFQLGYINQESIRNLLRTSGITGWTGGNDTPYSFNSTNWYFMCYSYNENNMDIYVNASNLNSAVVTGGIIWNTNNIKIAHDDGSNNFFSNFNINEIFIFNKALSQEEITLLYNHTKDKYIQETYNQYVSLVESDGGEIIDSNETLDMFNFLIDNDLYNNLVLGLSSSTGVKTRTSGSDLFVEKAYDFSGNNNHALQTTNENQPLLNEIGFWFNDTTNYLDVGNNSSIRMVNNFTVSTWIKTNNTSSSNQYFLSRHDSINNKRVWGYILRANQNFASTIFSSIGSNVTYSEGTTNVINNSWNHLIFTHIDGIVKLYVNGELDVEKSNYSSLFATDTSLRINGTTANGNLFTGNLNDIQIYNKALSQEEITLIYNQTKDKYQ